MKYPTKKENLKILSKIIAESKISKPLREAVEEIKLGVIENNVDLVSELTSVKSLISGRLSNSKEDPFNEDDDYNEKTLGNSVYSLLGTMNCDFSIKSDRIPSGMTIVSGGKFTSTAHTDSSKNPMVKKINREFELCHKRCMAVIKKRDKNWQEKSVKSVKNENQILIMDFVKNVING